MNLHDSSISPLEFSNAISSALIDAIPLIVLSKLRNFLWLGSEGVGTTRAKHVKVVKVVKVVQVGDDDEKMSENISSVQ